MRLTFVSKRNDIVLTFPDDCHITERTTQFRHFLRASATLTTQLHPTQQP